MAQIIITSFPRIGRSSSIFAPLMFPLCLNPLEKELMDRIKRSTHGSDGWMPRFEQVAPAKEIVSRRGVVWLS